MNPPEPKEVVESKVREQNMADLPELVFERHLQEEAKIIDNYYLNHTKELETRNAALDQELVTLKEKFIDLEKSYKNDITSIGQAVSTAHENKMKEIIDVYTAREAQLIEHIKKLEEHIAKLNTEITNLNTVKPTSQKKTTTMGRAARF
jgi:hypothetical protein